MNIMRQLTLSTVALSLCGCAAQTPPTTKEDEGLKKLARNTYVEDGTLLTVLASTRIATIRKDRGFMPIEIAIANKGLPELTLRRSSFTLVDETGQRYPIVTSAELDHGDYPNHDADRKLGELAPYANMRLVAFHHSPSNFTPGFVNAIVRDVVQLPRFYFMRDTLYFPRPATGMSGHRFELVVSAPELEQPVSVAIRVH